MVTGTAGLLASMLRVVTKLVVADIRLNTVLFFVVIVVILVVCCLAFLLTVRTDFVQFYVQLYVAAVQKEDDDRSSLDCGTDEVRYTDRYTGLRSTCAPFYIAAF